MQRLQAIASNAAIVAAFVLAVSLAAPARAGDARLWVARYDGPAGKDDKATAVAIARDGSRVYVVGSSQGPAGSAPVQTAIAYSRSGQPLWITKRAGVRSHPSIAVSPDGAKVFIASGSRATAYRASDGTVLWSVADTPGALIAVSPIGGVLFTAGGVADCLAVRA